MAEIYEKWVAAHAVIILIPVYWYQTPSVLKLMIDRLVCADGGNPDPTTANGKNAEKAKVIELAGWEYPKHLAGRGLWSGCSWRRGRHRRRAPWLIGLAGLDGIN